MSFWFFFVAYNIICGYQSNLLEVILNLSSSFQRFIFSAMLQPIYQGFIKHIFNSFIEHLLVLRSRFYTHTSVKNLVIIGIIEIGMTIW